MVEGFFSKLTKQMLNGIRVSGKEELESHQTALHGDKQLVHVTLVGLPAAAEIRMG